MFHFLKGTQFPHNFEQLGIKRERDLQTIEFKLWIKYLVKVTEEVRLSSYLPYEISFLRFLFYISAC